MSFLPSQRLSLGELFVSIAAGLMLFLLPNDAKNQFSDLSLAEGYVFVFSFVISVTLIFGIKRYEALGVAILSNSVLTAISFILYVINGICTKGNTFWAKMTEYQIITMFISWVIPFMIAVIIRLLRKGQGDTNDSRMRFSNFLAFSIRALMIIYLLVIIFRHLLAYQPHMSEERDFELQIFKRISECIDGTHENGIIYLLWNSLILAPLSFSLLILNPKIKIWHLLIICLCVGFTLEVLQFVLNTGTICSDDIILYMLGGMAGYLIKNFIDLIRSAITSEQDKCMLSFSYTIIQQPNRTKV